MQLPILVDLVEKTILVAPDPVVVLLLPSVLESGRLYRGVFTEPVAEAGSLPSGLSQVQLTGKPATGSREVSREIYLAPQRGGRVRGEAAALT